MSISNKKLQTSDRMEHSFTNLLKTNWSLITILGRALLIVALVSFAYYMFPLSKFDNVQSAGGFYEASGPQNPLQSTAILEPEPANIGLPIRLKIPGINVDAAIEHVGLTPDGEMGVPSKLVEAAWYNQGPRPGQKGNAVIDGHRSSRTWVPAVFDHLDDLLVGDNLYIEDDQGRILSFIVREIRTYDPEEDASDVFSLSDGIHLNLITCSGDWDKVKKSYNQRLVIFADFALCFDK